jgi:membrane-bound ClpP family serine protease
MSLGTILLVVIVLMLVGVIPAWPHSSSWGYGPSGVLGLVLVVIIVLLLMGRL